VGLGNTVISALLDTNSNHFSIFVPPIVWMSLFVLQTFLVDSLELLCSATLTASTTLTASAFSGERTDEGRRCFLSGTEPSLLNWLQSLLIVLNKGARRV
jgi:hypothetical protein